MRLPLSASDPLSQEYVALDLETTGLNSQQDQIIEVGAVKFLEGRVLDTFHSVVNPYRPLPAFIQRLTGISQGEVNSAPPFAVVAGEVEEFVGTSPLVGHNIAFDQAFLASHGLDLGNVAYDTWDLAAILLPIARDYSLSRLAHELGIEHPQPHRALADAQVTCRVFLALLERLQGLDPGLLALLSALARRSQSPIRHLLERAEVTGDVSRRTQVGLLGVDSVSLKQRLRPWQGNPTRVPLPRLDEELTASLLSPEGAVGRNFPNYEQRPQQVEMAKAVAKVLRSGGRLIVEGGTGIGKSVAYLLPAILFSLGSGKRVVVSTNTINLQEQLLGKDIPALIDALQQDGVVPPDELRATTLKGRGNYLCLRRLQHRARSEVLTAGELRLLGKAFVWLQQTGTGDRGEINLAGRDAGSWHLISASDKDYCPGTAEGVCFLRAARERAEGAHILVVNHALLLSDVARGGGLLPRYDYLIVDEAQHLEEVATSQLGSQVGQRLLAEVVESMGRLLGPVRVFLRAATTPQGLRDRGEEAMSRMETALSRLRETGATLWTEIYDFVAGHREGANERLQMRLTSGTRAQPAWSGVEVAWENTDLALGEALDVAAEISAVVAELEPQRLDDTTTAGMELSTWLDEQTELRERLRQLLVAPQEEHIYWVDQEESAGYLVLHAAPGNVGPELEKRLFAKKEGVILTSATLTVDGKFDHIRERTGFSEAEELLVGSPFDYRRAALVLIPEDVPQPDTLDYAGAVRKALIDVARTLEGRTLALFTSHSALRGAAQGIRGELEAAGVAVLAQGVDGTARRLAEAFSRDPRAVLLGTSSFWEGVDLSGGMLKALVLARLPFHVPTDPLFAARCEQYEEPFREYAVPQAVLRFRQGFGRLIRGQGDRGVVVILDRRIISRNYGSIFLNSLPPCAIKRVSIGSLARLSREWLGG